MFTLQLFALPLVTSWQCHYHYDCRYCFSYICCFKHCYYSTKTSVTYTTIPTLSVISKQLSNIVIPAVPILNLFIWSHSYAKFGTFKQLAYLTILIMPNLPIKIIWTICTVYWPACYVRPIWFVAVVLPWTGECQPMKVRSRDEAVRIPWWGTNHIILHINNLYLTLKIRKINKVLKAKRGSSLKRCEVLEIDEAEEGKMQPTHNDIPYLSHLIICSHAGKTVHAWHHIGPEITEDRRGGLCLGVN